MSFIAYFSGLFDADGWIHYRGENITLHIGQKELFLLSLVQEVYGGGICPVGRPPARQWFSRVSDSSFQLTWNALQQHSLVKLPHSYDIEDFDDVWFAGFFDGDGCISLDRRCISPHPRYIVVQSERDILELIQRHFGGRIQPARNSRGQTWFMWYSRLKDGSASAVADVLSHHARLKIPLVERRVSI